MPLSPQNLAHPCFRQPADARIRVWRYLDFAKLISLLASKALTLSRVDLLPDKFEGRYGRNFWRFQTAQRDEWIERVRVREGMEPSDPFLVHMRESPDLMKNSEEMSRANSYVSCWTSREHESEAMWRIYGLSSASVAITLPYERLRDSLPEDELLFIGCMNYFCGDGGASGNALSPMMAKRVEFSHESEVRILKWTPDHSSGIVTDKGWTPKADHPAFVRIPWLAEAHVESIVISPYAEDWQSDAISAAVAKLAPGLEQRVVSSAMRHVP